MQVRYRVSFIYLFISIIFVLSMEGLWIGWNRTTGKGHANLEKKGKEKEKEKKDEIIICPLCLYEVREKTLANHQPQHNGKHYIYVIGEI